MMQSVLDHPAHLLRPTRLFSLDQRASIKGDHDRLRAPARGFAYAMGAALSGTPSRITVTVTIAALDREDPSPALRIVTHVTSAVAGVPAARRLLDSLAARWGCHEAAIGIAPGLETHFAPEGVAFTPLTPGRRAELAAALLEAVNAGRVKVYASDSSAESRDFWAQVVKAQSRVLGGLPDFFVTSGGDGYVASLALAVEAATALLAPVQGTLADLLCA
jgi:hypothetical protein